MRVYVQLQLFSLMVISVVKLPGQIPVISDAVAVNMGKSSQVEFANPLLSTSGLNLFFVTSFDELNVGGRLAGQDIWMLSRDSVGGAWTTPANITSLNNYENNSVLGVGNGDSLLYLLNTYSSKNRWKHALVISELTEDSVWSNPTEVKLKIPFLDDFRNLYVSPDGQLIIVSGVFDRSTGEDLFVYFQQQGVWSGPISLEGINTPDSEISPFYYAPREALFFASNRPGGFGDYDIYVSYKQGDWNHWTAPIHLDETANSEAFDAYLSIYDNGESFIVSSKNDNSSTIYRGWMNWVEIYQEDTLEQVSTDTIMLDSTAVVRKDYEKETETVGNHESIERIVQYAVQVIAMPRGQNPSVGFFDNLDYSQIQMTQGKDGLDRYYLGIYDSFPDAKSALRAIRRKGYDDAFVRALVLYQSL